MTRTQLFNLRKIKYFFTLLAQKTILAVLALDGVMISRISTDLTVKGLSLNQILEHFRLIYGLKLTKDGLRLIRKQAAKNAKKVNKHLDREIAGKINTTEADEIFQGKHNLILGIAEKWSQYILGLQYSEQRDIKALKAFLIPIGRRFQNIRVVITDLLKSYRKAVKKAFKRARHLGCHVHARRDVMRFIDKLKLAYKRQKTKFEKAEKFIAKMTSRIQKKAKVLQDSLNLTAKDKKSLKTLKTRKKLSKQTRTKTFDRQIAAARKRLTKRASKIKAMKAQLSEFRVKKEKARKEVRKTEKGIKKKYHEHLQACRIAGDFYRLLADQSREFEVHIQQFTKRLKSSGSLIATKLDKLIRDNPHLFSLHHPKDLAPNFQNSNTIERIFGIFRPLLNSTRLIRSPEGTNEYCDLFRLYHNTTPRFTGINNDRSPFEQLGGKFHGKTYLDLLFPLKGRTTIFLATDMKVKTHLGFYVRGIPGSGAVCVV